jgi:phospholipid-binding lipoprotein MlaA
VVPIFGPRTLRDASALIVDRYYSAPWRVITDTTGPYIAITTLELVDARANLLFATQMIGDVALDRYSFVRDSYLARRLDQVYDGAPPLEVFDTEPDSAPPPK